MSFLHQYLKISTTVVVFLALVAIGRSHAAEELVQFSNPEHKVMYQQLLREYRCLKCQNQNLADSNAGLAGDLRREIRGQIEAGKSQSDIETYLVARYGEFVLYRPRFNSTTFVLWIGPFILLAVALFSLVKIVRSKNNPKNDANTESGQPKRIAESSNSEKLIRARELLGKK